MFDLFPDIALAWKGFEIIGRTEPIGRALRRTAVDGLVVRTTRASIVHKVRYGSPLQQVSLGEVRLPAAATFTRSGKVTRCSNVHLAGERNPLQHRSLG